MKAIHFLVGVPVALFGATWLFWAGLWWDAGRPAGWPSYTIAVGPFHHTFRLPDGYGARYRADEADRKAWADALNQCHANTDKLRGSLDTQNASIAAAGKDSAQRLQAAQEAVRAGQSALSQAQAQSAAILAHRPSGADACARVMDVDRQLLEALK